MKDKELRKLIGSRIKQRRLELNLTQPYVAEKMGVTASTILRYENGSIDNTKKMVLEGLSEALHVSAVSYTHLDVYKRQMIPSLWASRSGGTSRRRLSIRFLRAMI